MEPDLSIDIAAVGRVNPCPAPTGLILKHGMGEFLWIANTHTTVREGPFIAVEQLLHRRVVKVDCVLVRETELDLSKCVFRSRRLAHMQSATAPLTLISPRDTASHLGPDDGLRNVPVRIEDDGFHFVGKHRCLLRPLANDNALLVNYGPIPHHANQIFRNVDMDIFLAQIAWCPAPAFQINQQCLFVIGLFAVQHAAGPGADDTISLQAICRLKVANCIRHIIVELVCRCALICCYRDLQTLTQQSDMGMAYAEL